MEELISRNSVQWELGHDVEEYSDASGTKSGRNAICHAGCNFKRKSKRGSCFRECDVKFPPSGKQREKRQDSSDRTKARKEKREGKKECKERYESGELTKGQYKDCVKSERKEKRTKIKEAGGSFLARAGRVFTKVFPITAGSRGGVIVLAKQNAFGISTRLAPAILPTSQAEQKFKKSSIEKAKKGWAKTQKIWRDLGGDTNKLRKAILDGYKKKPTKVGRKSKFSGVDEYTLSKYSNIEAGTVSLIALGIGTVGSILEMLNKQGVDKNPFKEGETPDDYSRAMEDGDLDTPPQDMNAPALDPATGKWFDPNTGKEVDPLTGEAKNEILGMNKWLVIGLGVAVAGSVAYLLIRPKK